MPLPSLPVHGLDDINHRRRSRETINNILNHQFDDSKVRTSAEISAGVTPVNYAYPPGDIRRYGAKSDGSDSFAAIKAAADVANANGATGCSVYIPQGTWTVIYDSGRPSIELAKANIYGDGKFLSVIYATGYDADVPIFTLTGTSGVTIDGTYYRDFTLWSANSQARGFTASWLKNAVFENLYFFQLYNGFVGDVCFTVKAEKCTSFGTVLDEWVLGDDCNNWHFDLCRVVGRYGIHVTGHLHALKVSGLDAEGIHPADAVSANCAGIRLAPSSGKVVHAVDISGCYSETVEGFFLSCDGIDSNSVRGLNVHANYITGGYQDHFSSTSGKASHAIRLYNTLGFSIHDNFFSDWETDAIQTNGTEFSGRITDNTATLTPTLANSGLQAYTYSANNFEGRGEGWRSTDLFSSPIAGAISDLSWNTNIAGDGTGGGGGPLLFGAVAAGSPATFAGFGEPLRNIASTYGATVATNAALGSVFTVTVTNNTAFTMSNPTNGFSGQRIRIRIKNTSGGAMGAITWASTFRVGSWTNPADGNSRCIDFDYDGTNWIQSTIAADVPN